MSLAFVSADVNISGSRRSHCPRFYYYLMRSGAQRAHFTGSWRLLSHSFFPLTHQQNKRGGSSSTDVFLCSKRDWTSQACANATHQSQIRMRMFITQWWIIRIIFLLSVCVKTVLYPKYDPDWDKASDQTATPSSPWKHSWCFFFESGIKPTYKH